MAIIESLRLMMILAIRKQLIMNKKITIKIKNLMKMKTTNQIPIIKRNYQRTTQQMPTVIKILNLSRNN